MRPAVAPTLLYRAPAHDSPEEEHMPRTRRRWFGLRAEPRIETQETSNGWSSWPGEAADRVREASRNLPNMKDVHMPEVRIPEVHMPDVRLPNVRIPEVRIPDVRLPQLRRRTPWYQRLLPAATAAGIAAASGAAIAYFLDPERGRARRAVTVDRLAATARRTARSAARTGRKLSSDANGWTHMVASIPARRNRQPLDDATLAHKVETELFRDSDVPKATINVNAENGVIVVRGEVPSMDVARQIEIRVLRIDGVKEVHNLLHEPSTQPRAESTTTDSMATSEASPSTT
jgi:BON domain-containing protein